MKKNVLANKTTTDFIFCLAVLAIPMIQFAIFYVGVNITSFAMIFQKYEVDPITNRGAYLFLFCSSSYYLLALRCLMKKP